MKDQAKTKKQLIGELETLRKEKTLSETMINSLPGIFCLFDESGHIIQWNRYLEIVSEYSSEEIKKMNPLDFFSGEEKALVGESIQEVFVKGASHVEADFISKDGRRTPFYFKGLRFMSGNRFYLIGIAIEITDRKRAEEDLQESEELFRRLFENHSAVKMIIDPDTGDIIDANEAAESFYGWSREQLKHMKVYEINTLPPEEVKKEMEKVRANKRTHFEFRHSRADGSIRDVEVFSSKIDTKEKELLHSIIHDISDRKHAEEALLKEKTFSDTMINSLPGIFYLFDEHGSFVRWNRNFEIVSGYSSEEIDKMNPLDFFSGEEKALLGESIQEVLVKGESHVEANFISKDGRITPYYFTGLRFISDNRPYLVGMGIDITERKRAEEELHDSFFAQAAINIILSESLEERPLEEILQKALNMILSIPWLAFEAIGSIHIVENEPGVLVMKAEYNLPDQLKKLCAHVSWGTCLCGRAALTQKIEFSDHIDERHDICYEGMEPHGHYIVPILFGGRTLGVIAIYLKEGHIRDQDEEEFLLTVADTLAGIIVRRQIENEKEKLQAQLLQSQKMEAVGQLAGGVAHDFNNILTAMIGYGHLLKMKLKEEDPLKMYADHILSLSDKAANLTKSLLAFSRKQIINPRPVDINEIIKRIDHLLTRIIGEDIQLQTILSENDLIAMADSGQIEQVLMNLAANARDAMPKGGVLTIATETFVIDNEFIREHGFGKKGQHVLISVADTGAGMDRETREKIFEPFFTTKEVGKGTGLGLAMVYGIIKQHEGHINVYSEPGRGATFRIYLPLIEAQAEEIKHEDMIPPKVTGTETVLLAEDEAELREFTKNLLKEYGYNVITAVNGQDAVNEFKIHKHKIQLLLFDVIMPNKNGKEAYEEIKQVRPDIRVIFMSGYPADVIHKQGILEKGFAYIEKPVSPPKLLKKIREVLGE
jgi:PAS domain S-box-containing protein